MTKRLQRQSDAPVAGVCAGIGDYLSVDPTLIRLGFAFLALFRGVGLAMYGICWLILPDGDGHSILESLLTDRKQLTTKDIDSRAAGLALIGIGLVLLVHTVAPILNWTAILSLFLIGGGILFIYTAWKEKEHGDE